MFKQTALAFSSLILLSVCINAQSTTASTPTLTTPSTAAVEKPKRAPIFRANKEQIKTVQNKLKAEGIYAGELTGKLDQDTRAAIKTWQTGHGLRATATLNRATLEKFGVELTEKQKLIPISANSYEGADGSALEKSLKSNSKDQIVAVMNAQQTAWNLGDIDGFMIGYWNSPDLVFVSTNVTRGWQPTLERYKKAYDSREKMGTLTFSDLEVNVLSKDAAVVLGKWKLARKSDSPGGYFTLIFRRFKDGWRIVMDHTS